MSEDIWFSEDIHQIILAAIRANQDALSAGLVGGDPWRSEAYHQGFRTALSTLSVALGLPELGTVEERGQRAFAGSGVADVHSPYGVAVWPAGEEEALEGGSALVR